MDRTLSVIFTVRKSPNNGMCHEIANALAPIKPGIIRISYRLGYCFTPYQRLWLYNGAPLVAFYDTLGIWRTCSRLKSRRPHACVCLTENDINKVYSNINIDC